jgi:GIY-YIG catalytic domain
MVSFGEILCNVGFSEVLLFDEIHGGLPQLHHFFEQANKRKYRKLLFMQIGIENLEKKYENSPLKLSKTILETVGIEHVTLPRRRIDGIPQSPFAISSESLLEVRALVVSGDKQGIANWLDSRYKNHKMKCGVYQILHKPTGQFYLGSSCKLNLRIKQHLTSLKNGEHSNLELQNLWNESSEEDFTFEILKRTMDYQHEEKKLIKDADKNFLLNRQGNDLFQREVTITKKAKGAGD